eukprot:jgi/Tetstr1/421419/TSEL_012368.t1
MSETEVFSAAPLASRDGVSEAREGGHQTGARQGAHGREADCFWGHWVDGEGVFPQHSKVAAVVKMPPPTDVARQRRFPGMVGYYGKFIEQVAVKRKPLIKLTGKVL